MRSPESRVEPIRAPNCPVRMLRIDDTANQRDGWIVDTAEMQVTVRPIPDDMATVEAVPPGTAAPG